MKCHKIEFLNRLESEQNEVSEQMSVSEQAGVLRVLDCVKSWHTLCCFADLSVSFSPSMS